MKKLLLLSLIAIVLFACNESTTEPEVVEVDKTFRSHNVKENGKHYFTFATNTASITDDGNWDIAFGSVPLTVETAPCEYFIMPNDPVILCGTNVSIAKIEATTIEEVTTVPAASEFNSDNNMGSAIIGKNWFDQNYQVNNDVYVLKSCAGNFALLEIEKYEIDMTSHQITSLSWKFKYNNTGSTDFSSIDIDSVTSKNAYTETRYYSFANGAVPETSPYDIKISGSTIWLGNDVTVKKLEDKSISDITTISDANFISDTLPSYITLGWYEYGEGHLLTPKDYVYVINTDDGKYPAFEISNYYDDEGNSGTYTIEWKYLK